MLDRRGLVTSLGLGALAAVVRVLPLPARPRPEVEHRFADASDTSEIAVVEGWVLLDRDRADGGGMRAE